MREYSFYFLFPQLQLQSSPHLAALHSTPTTPISTRWHCFLSTSVPWYIHTYINVSFRNLLHLLCLSISSRKVFASVLLGDYIIRKYIVKRLRDRKLWPINKSIKAVLKKNSAPISKKNLLVNQDEWERSHLTKCYQNSLANIRVHAHFILLLLNSGLKI